MTPLEAECRAKGLAWIDGEGPLDAKVWIVGEALGREEEADAREREKVGLKGRPFVGGAGHLLTAALSQANIAREACRVTNVVRVRPPNNELGRLHELGLTIKEFIPLLKDDLERGKPNVVVALGGAALEALTSLKGIMSWRGSIVPSSLVPGLKVIPSVHPAAILRQYKWRPLLVMDLKKVRRQSEFPEIRLLKRTFLVVGNYTEFEAMFQYLIEQKRIAFDIEVGIDGSMSCLGLSNDPAIAFCIPFRRAYLNYWAEGEEFQIWRRLRELFQMEKRWVAQNALFDMRWLVPKVGYFEVWMDTMWAHQTMYAEIAKGLDMLASLYTDEPYYKDERKVWKDTSITEQLWSYNCKDAAVTVEVASKLEEELKSLKMEEFFFGYVMKLLPVLLKLQLRGMRVDLMKRGGIKEDLQKREKELESLIPVNVRSPKQMKEFLYGELGMPVQYDKKKGTITTGKRALEQLRRKV